MAFIGSPGGAAWRRILQERQDLGVLMGPRSWRTPYSRRYVLDNDVYRNSVDRGGRLRPLEERMAWWRAEGERKWLRMLDKIPEGMPPLFCILPDVVASWSDTTMFAARYRSVLRERGLREAIALQDGCDDESEWLWLEREGYTTLFVGGSTAWKWGMLQTLRDRFPRAHLHVGRVNGAPRLHYCKYIVQVDSCDGTGVNRHSEVLLPEFFAALDGKEPQRRLFCGVSPARVGRPARNIERR